MRITILNKRTGERLHFNFGIQRMKYHNELILCESWGYDNGQPTWKNNPDTYEIESIEGYTKDRVE